jgi:hypothetical protein
MEQTHTLTTSAGTLNDQILTTPLTGGDITVTATGGGQQGTTVVHAVTTPSDVAIRNSSNAIITSMKVTAGSTTKLTATAAYRRVSLYADPEAFTWTVTGNIGTIDDQGTFTAADPSTVTESISGTITVSAGGVSAAINVTVTELSLKTLENFEDRDTVFSGVNATLSQATGSEHVRLGQGAGKVDYTLDSYDDYTGSYASELRFAADRIAVSPYTLLTMWVYGDNSGNTLYLEYFDGTSSGQLSPITTLGFTGWKQVAVPMGQNIQELEGLVIQGSGTGTIYLDQLVLSYNNIMDDTVPEITLETSGTALVGTISDAVDSVLPKSSVSVTWDGEETNFTYNETTGAFSTSLVSDGNPHRITVTAVDASGNIGRASYDVPVAANWQPNFKDTKGYWGATYADFLLLSGITTGYADGTFRPNQNITRAQFAAMLYRYLGLEANQYTGVTLPFADTDAIPDYALPAIRALYAEGVINGSTGSDGQLYFNPSASLTRAQAATMIGRTQAKGYATVSLSFSDADKIPSYATYYIQTMAAQGVIGGYTDGTFRPNSNITRGQMAKILYNLM